MSRKSLPTPEYLPVASLEIPGALPELALDLCRRVAELAREAAEQEKKARQEVEQHAREAGRALARVAAARFELGRVLARVLPMLAESGREDVSRILELFARSWDADLERAQIEVQDVTGQPITDELAAIVEVEGAVPEPEVRQAMVRETLSPLVLWAGRAVGVARVITSVPVHGTIERELAIQTEEES